MDINVSLYHQMTERNHRRDRIAAIDRNISVPDVFVMRRVVEDVTWQARATMTVLLFFGAFAAGLSAVGIYAVMASMVAARTQEIGVRMALGARRWDVFGMVIGDAARPVALGIAAGLGAAAILTRAKESMLFGVALLELAVFAAGTLAIATVAGLACLGPARRAAALDPVHALREE
jgi:ABC-type antimicrobial peptide transport system permease subunit